MKAVHLFDLDIYLKCDPFIKNLINKKLRETNTSIRKLSKECRISHSSINSFLKENSMRTTNFIKISNFLKIKQKEIEGNILEIYSGPYKYFKYKIKFPIRITPLNIRLVSHSIGDGSLEKNNCRWYQKNKFGRKQFKKLVNKICNLKIKDNKKYACTIPILIIDIVCSALNIKRNEIDGIKFLKQVINLPKIYRLQALSAIILDEGHIRKSCISICNTNEELLKYTKKIAESLNYNCSKIKNQVIYKNKYIFIKGIKANINYQLKNFLIYADGLLKYYNDIQKMSQNYGLICNLWHKQKDLEKYSKKVDLNKLNKTRDSKKNLIPLIIKSIKQKPIKVSDFAKKNNLCYLRAYKLFYRLKNKKLIKKVGVGIFASNKYKGKIKTLRNKIEEAIKNKKIINIKEIVNITKGKSKSVSAQLSKFKDIKNLRKIKKGIYIRN